MNWLWLCLHACCALFINQLNDYQPKLMALSYDLKLYLLHFGGSFVIPRPHCSGLMVFNHVNHLMLWTLRKSGLRVTQSHCHYICFCYYNFVYTSSLFLYDLCFVTFWCRCCAVAAQTNKYKYVNINEMPFCICLSVCRL